MTDRYWISNITGTANTAGNWNTAANGSGSTGVPTTGDDVFFGHATTLTANLGNGPCVWDLAVTLGTITTTDDYVGFTHTATNISFTAPNTITMADGDWLLQGFRVGMEIRVSGAANAANNNAFTILSITDNVILTTSVAIVTEAAGPSISVLYEAFIDLQAHIGVNLLILKNNLQNTSGSKKTISFAGTYDGSADSRYILNGENASISNQDHIEYLLDSSANGVAPLYFDDGPYPSVTITSATRWSCGYKAPSSGVTGVVTMYHLTVGTSTTMAVDSTATPVQNESKVFSILNTSTFLFSPTATAFEAGKSTWIFTMDATGFAFPVSDDTKTYYWYNVILATPKTAGFKTTIASNRTLSVNSLTVEADAVLEGHKTLGGPTSTVVSVRRPKILGAWNFSQISDGIYASLIETAYPITPASGPVGRVQVSNGSGAFTNDEKLTWTTATSTLLVDGKLTVTGLIDPTGMEFTAVGANPSSANPDKTIWVNSVDSKLYFGSSEVGGGGGSGTVTSVATTAPITGGTITGAGTIGIDISALTANTQIADADLLLLDDGANGTNRKTTFDEVAQWIRGEGVMVGRNGGVNKLRIRDSRDDGQLTPDDWGNKQVSFDFTDQYNSVLPSAYWANVITFKGWTDSYRVAQLMTSATSEGSGNKDTEPLYFRSGEDSGWGAMREILTFPIGASGSTPNADGAAGQILQTNGAGTLSWVDGPAGLEYEKYTLGDTIPSSGSIANGVTTQLTFGSSGSTLVPTYGTTLTSWTVNLVGTHIDILQDGLYQFNFVALIASLGTANADYRLTISSTSSLTGDLLSFRNRTSYIDRYTGNGATTVYLTTGDTVYFSVRQDGNAYEVGGTIVGPEVRTFLDVRRIG